ncbi:MAG: 4Fe-4S binding protein [Bacillota bacterium]
MDGETALVKAERCRLCGYCGAVCPLFAIKVI